MLYKNREKFNKISIKVGMLFSKFSLTPNQWTLLSIVPVIFAAYFITQEKFLYGAILFAIGAFLDLVDGSVARVTGHVSKFGGYWDTTMDRYVEGLIIASLLFVPMPAILTIPMQAWILLFLFGSIMTPYVKAAAKEKDIVKEEIKGGLLERAERLSILFLALIAAHFNILYLAYVIVILAILTNLSSLQRILAVRQLARQ